MFITIGTVVSIIKLLISFINFAAEKDSNFVIASIFIMAWSNTLAYLPTKLRAKFPPPEGSMSPRYALQLLFGEKSQKS
jgi:hypothetical protein